MDKVIHRLLTHNSEENWIRSGTNRPKDKGTKKQKYRQRNGQRNRQRNRHTDKETDKETD